MVEDVVPVLWFFGGEEGLSDGFGGRVHAGVFDAELSHEAWGLVRAIEGQGEVHVCEHDIPLFREGGLMGLVAGSEVVDLLEEPGVSQYAACDDAGIEACLFEQVEGGLGSQHVARAEDGPVGVVFFDASQEVPIGAASIFLLDAAGVNGDRGSARLAGPFGEVPEVFFRVGILETLSDFEGHGFIAADFLDDGLDDFDDEFGVAHEKAAPPAPQGFIDGAGEVQVDDIEVSVREQSGGMGHDFGFVAYELSCGGVVIFVARDEGDLLFAGNFDAAVEHHFGGTQRRAEPAAQCAEGQIGVPCQWRKRHGRGKRERANGEGREGSHGLG